MAIWDTWFGKKEITETKEVPQGVAFSDTMSRGAISKAYYPGFLVKPPFGWPKFKNVFEIRRVAATPQAAMAINAIIDEIVSIPWDIVPKEGFTEEDPVTAAHIQEVKQFFLNPNPNKESFQHIQRILLKEILELDSGVLVKEFNEQGQMVEMRAMDSAGFLKNPDPYGKYTTRDELIIEDFVNVEVTQEDNTIAFTPATTARPGGLSVADAQNRAAYFQYGYLTSARPVPFGLREIVWIERNPISHDIYGRSAIENLIDVLNTLIYSILYNLEYFEDNNVPKGFIQLGGASRSDLEDFKDKWNDLQLQKDPNSGRLRKIFHKVPVTSSPNAKFERIQFSAQELELVTSQKWFTKLTWSMFGVTPSELGFTDDSNRATEIVQSKVFRRRGILPILELLAYHYNKEVVSEFEFDDVEFTFNTFDIDEETTKYKLYKLQVDSRIKTINEIRREEGMEEVEWGDMPQNSMSGLNPVQQFNPDMENQEDNFNRDRDQQQENKGITYEEETEQIRKSKKSPEAMQRHKFKPAVWTHKNGHPRCKVCGDEETMDGMCSGNMKALTAQGTRGNITLDENEVIGQFRKLLENSEKEIIGMVRSEARRDRLSKIRLKNLETLARKIEQLFTFDGMRNTIMKAIEGLFLKGWADAETILENKADQPADFQRQTANKEQIEFLQRYTFDNIKGANEDIKNKLRQELRRGVIEGEGVGKVAERVKGVFDTSRKRAEDIVRTEMNRAENQGSLQAMRKSGIVKTKTWLSSDDTRTSALCKRLDGQTVGINEKFTDKVTGESWDAPPSHVNCRADLLFDAEE